VNVSTHPEPSYLKLLADGTLQQRAEQAMRQLAACNLCPRLCGVDRLAGERGFCRSGALAQVASANVHMWEEPPISGTRGSGTVFFSNCTANCLFCQNYPISQLGVGCEYAAQGLAKLMLDLQRRGCHNINLVTPTHYVAQIIAAVALAARQGLQIPILYNTSGYDRVETLQLLEGIVDIYLPDSKYTDDAVARQLSRYVDYVANNRAALLEMRRQVGLELQLDADGLAYRGLIVRHLVLPEDLSQTPQVLRWLADNLGREVYVSLMSQYFPAHKAIDHAQLGRGLTVDEYLAALDAFDDAGLDQGWRQELEHY